MKVESTIKTADVCISDFFLGRRLQSLLRENTSNPMDGTVKDYYRSIELTCEQMSRALDIPLSSVNSSIPVMVRALKKALLTDKKRVNHIEVEAFSFWMCDRWGKNGARVAFEFRQWLVKNDLAQASTFFNLAWQIDVGQGCEQDLPAAHQLFQRALELETNETLLRELILTKCASNFVDGRGTKADPALARSYLLAAQIFGSSVVSFNLGLFFEGKFGEIPHHWIDNDLAATYYKVAMNEGNSSAQTNLALLHVYKKIADSNPTLGMEMLVDASSKGDAVATACLKTLINRTLLN